MVRLLSKRDSPLPGVAMARGLARRLTQLFFAVHGPANVPTSVVAGWSVLRRAEFAGRADGAV